MSWHYHLYVDTMDDPETKTGHIKDGQQIMRMRQSRLINARQLITAGLERLMRCDQCCNAHLHISLTMVTATQFYWQLQQWPPSPLLWRLSQCPPFTIGTKGNVFPLTVWTVLIDVLYYGDYSNVHHVPWDYSNACPLLWGLQQCLSFIPFMLWGLQQCLSFIPFTLWGLQQCLSFIPFTLWGLQCLSFIPFILWGLQQYLSFIPFTVGTIAMSVFYYGDYSNVCLLLCGV